jgi:enoyl-CoA hydratase/carnithine racemase
VQRLVDADELPGRRCSWPARSRTGRPIATQRIKHMVRIAQSTSLDVGLLYENDSFSACMATEDAAEGRAAFAEKRPPHFHGR